MYAISEVVAPISCTKSLYVRFGEYEAPILIRFLGDRVVFSWFDGQAIEDLLRIPAKSEILAGSNLRWTGSLGNTLILLDKEYNLSLLYQDSRGKYVEKTVTKLSTHGQQQSPGSKPLIAIDGSKDGDDCFVMHVFLRTIQLVTLCHGAAQRLAGVELKNKKRRALDLEALLNITTVYIGNVDVQAMEFLAHESVLAVLYSTYEFDYKLRYYKADPAQNAITMIKQFESFSEPVSCIVPVKQGGLLAISGAHIFYFPAPGCSVLISLDCEDPHLTRNRDGDVATKYMQSQSMETEQVVSHVIIDDQRVLLVTQRGETKMLFFEADRIGSNMIIKNLVIISLGKSTIPITGGLHYINKDMFLQVSRTSQLVLFLVSTQKPYIRLKSQIELTGPVLDLCLVSRHLRRELITCQGAFYNSEIRKYEQAKHSLIHLKTLNLNGVASSMINVSGADEFLVVRADTTASTINFRSDKTTQSEPKSALDYKTVIAMRAVDGAELCLTEQGLMVAEKMEHDSSLIQDIAYGMFLEGNAYIAIMRFGEIQLHHSVKPTHKKSLPNIKGVILLDGCKIKDDSFFLVLWRDGNYKIFSESLECVFESSIDSDAYSGVIVASSGLSDTCDEVHVVILTCEGSIFQTRIDVKKGKTFPNNAIVSPASAHALKMRKEKSLIIAFNRTTLLGLKLDLLLNIFLASPFESNFKDVDDIIIKNDQLYILRAHRQIGQYALAFNSRIGGIELRVIHAPKMKNKCAAIPQLKCCVVACSEEIDVDQYQLSLELIDTDSMQILHKQQLHRGPNPIADIFPLPNERNTFIVLPLEGNGDFYLFRALEGELRQISCSTLTNLVSQPQVAEAKLKSISIYDIEQSIFVVSGTIVFYIQLEAATSRLKVCESPCQTVPYMSLGHTIANKTVFVCDVVEGLLKCEKDVDNSSFLRVALPYAHKFATCIDSMRLPGSDIIEIMVGDAFGNVLISHFNGNDCEQVCAFNVGSQVNTLERFDKSTPQQEYVPICAIGTVSGAIYKISRIADKSQIPIFEACQNELASASIAFNKSKLDWKLPQSGFPEPREYFGIVDIRLFQKFLASLLFDHDCKTDQSVQKHIQAKKHKDLLAKIYFCTKAL